MQRLDNEVDGVKMEAPSGTMVCNNDTEPEPPMAPSNININHNSITAHMQDIALEDEAKNRY